MGCAGGFRVVFIGIKSCILSNLSIIKMASFTPVLSFARQMSTTSAAAQLVKAPVQLFTLEGRYATALYSAATKQKALPQVEKDLLAFNALVQKDKPLNELLSNPLNPKSLKKDAIASVLAKSKASPLTVNLFSAMAENGRLQKLSQVVESFETIMAAERGEIKCEVTTAKALSAAQLKEIQTVLGGFIKKGQVLKLSTKVDASIIGGMLVSIGDKYVDMSMGTKINKYKQAISTAI